MIKKSFILWNNVMLVYFAIRTKCSLLTENKTLFRIVLNVSVAYRHRIACSFACHVYLRPEWAAACREFVSISLRHHRLSLIESGFPEFLIFGFSIFFLNPLDHRFQYWWSSRSFSPTHTAFPFDSFLSCLNMHCSLCIFREFSRRYTLRSLVRLYSSIL